MELFFNYFKAIAFLMIANTILVSIDKVIEGGFDWKKLFMGLLRYVAIFIACLSVVYSGTIVPNIEIIDGLNLLKLMEGLAIAIIVKYGVSVFNNLKTLFEIEMNSDEEGSEA